MENIIPIAGTLFSAVFMLILAGFLFKALTKVDLTTLFLGTDGKVSPNKFWSSIAYFVATVAFLGINAAAPGSAGLEFIWLIYLAVVASAQVLTSFIATKYGGTEAAATRQDPE